MTKKEPKYSPQISYYYRGFLYPFVSKTSLKELIAMRQVWLANKSPYLYLRKERALHTKQLACIEQCIRILFSEPDASVIEQKIKNDQMKLSKRNNEMIGQLKAKGDTQKLAVFTTIEKLVQALNKKE